MYGEFTTPGIILTSMAVGEYDRRVTVLTARAGRISAFARGARRQAGPLSAYTCQFTYAEFTFAERRDSYELKGAENVRPFEELAADMEAMMYGSYFCELMSFLTRENIDETPQLKLLYVTLSALSRGNMDFRLIRSVFELRAIAEYGEAMRAEGLYYSERNNGLTDVNDAGSIKVDTSTLHAVQFAQSVRFERLYSFRVSDHVRDELEYIVADHLKKRIDKPMKSLAVLEQMKDFN